MARRGEGQHVAIDVGLRNDPKVLGLARRLKLHKLHAVGLVASWREFVLTKGTGAGVVKGYSRQELAEFLDWPKGPAVVIDALKAAGMLRMQRTAFVYPFWVETITGDYANYKSTDRERKALERELRPRWAAAFPGHPWPGLKEAQERLRGHSAEAPGSVHGQSEDAPEGSGHKETNGPPGPPVPGGVGGVASARIGLKEWFFETHPRLKNEVVCAKLLDRMTEAQAVQLRYCLPRQLPRYISGMTSRGGRGVVFADKYLKEHYYLEYRPPKPKAAKQAQQNGQTRAEDHAQKVALVEQQEALWKKRDEVRARLKADATAKLTKFELEALIDQELEKEGETLS